MSDFSDNMKERTMRFAEAVLRLIGGLPQTAEGRVIANQLADCSTSVAANYRATCNARSRREFIAKLGLVVEESDESACWLELIRRRRLVPLSDLDPILTEATEVRNILAAAAATARANARAAHKSNRPINQMNN